MNSSSVPPFPPSPVLCHTLNSRGELGMFVNPYTCSCSTCKDYLAGNTAEEVSEDTTAPTDSSFAVLSAIGEASIRQRKTVSGDPLEDLARVTESFEERWRAAGGGTLRSPSTGGTSTTWYLGAMLDDIQERHKELGLPEYSPPSYTPPRAIPFGKQATEPALSSTTLEDMLRECRQPPPPVQPSRLRALASASSLLSLPPPPPLVRVNAYADCLGRNPLAPVDEEDVMDQLSSLRSRLQLRRDHPMSLDIDNEEAVEAADQRYADLTKKIQAIESVLQVFGIPFRNP